MVSAIKKILIIEDDISLSNGISLALKDSESSFVQVKDLCSARQNIETSPFDLIILDINLPDGNGLDFLKELRKSSAVPVVILTANDMETDVVTGLELGADDYITKPFSLMILRARVNARLRSCNSASSDTMHVDNFLFSFGKMEFSKNGAPVELSKTEQKLLRILIENRGSTLTRAQLVDMIWTDGAEYVDENATEAVYNIIDNAVKYSPAKSTIKIKAFPYEMFCRIDIADEGIGITEDEQNKIFLRFYRSAAVSGQEGVGIGLFLAREIISSGGGYIRVSSKPGQGSIFSVFLPTEKR